MLFSRLSMPRTCRPFCAWSWVNNIRIKHSGVSRATQTIYSNNIYFCAIVKVKELIYKRGYGKVNKQRIPLTENAIIEANLGKHGIICIEDLVHEIISVGPHFKASRRK